MYIQKKKAYFNFLFILNIRPIKLMLFIINRNKLFLKSIIFCILIKIEMHWSACSHVCYFVCFSLRTILSWVCFSLFFLCWWQGFLFYDHFNPRHQCMDICSVLVSSYEEAKNILTINTKARSNIPNPHFLDTNVWLQLVIMGLFQFNFSKLSFALYTLINNSFDFYQQVQVGSSPSYKIERKLGKGGFG